MREQVKAHILTRIQQLEQQQQPDGTWRMAFQGPIMTDCFTIILLKTLSFSAEEQVNQLVASLLRTQQENGSWQLYQDEKKGNLSATVQAYTALLISGRLTRKNEEMKRAERFINQNGGLGKTHFMTKMMLAMNGLYPYPSYFYFPMTYFLLHPAFPLSMYYCSNYARVHLTPMIICLNKKFANKYLIDDGFFKENEDDAWFRENRDSWGAFFVKEIKHIALTPLHLHKAGYKAAEKLMLDRIEANGTLYSYVSASFYMIYSLLALGYEQDHPIIQKAIQGILNYQTQTPHGLHIQNSPSTVWDTALLSYALQEAGVSYQHPMIQKANSYLQHKQQIKKGDWSVNAPTLEAGGWGFSDTNTLIPDQDDTSAALRALTRMSMHDTNVRLIWDKGLNYLVHMQNKDGGWGAFEKNAYNPIFKHIPLENAKDALIDDSSSDITGRVLEYLGKYAQMKATDKQVRAAVNWLFKQQYLNGSWYGKWGICYIYGTWAAVTGLRAVGMEANHPSIVKAVEWLESIQREDGGWGESCRSAEEERFIPLPYSTPSQTAWALDAILTVRKQNAPSIRKGIQFLLDNDTKQKEGFHYPTGLGLPGGFYIYYQSYNEIFPLLALGHYLHKNDS